MKNTITSEQALKLRNEYAKLDGKDTKFTDWRMKQVQRIVELPDGTLFVIEKPSIKTHFCFGYGYCGVSSEEESDEASAMAQHARTREDYFIDKNMDGFSPFDDLNEHDTKAVYKYNPYYVSTKIVELTTLRAWEAEQKGEFYKPLSAEEERILRQAYEEEKERHLARLKTYLKRYGLSKVRSWTYLSD